VRTWLIRLLGGIPVPKNFETLSYQLDFSVTRDATIIRVFEKTEPRTLILKSVQEDTL
jgi:hypothetical protein